MTLKSDIALPDLTEINEETPEIENIELRNTNHTAWPLLLDPNQHSTPCITMVPQEWRLELEGIGWFRATNGQILEWERWNDSVSDRDIRTFLVTSGLGALAIQRGELVVHGTALERDGRAIALLGHPTTGKSTLAWCLLQQGWRLISSEVTVIKADRTIPLGPQHIKLWHDATQKLGIEAVNLPLVRRGLKRYRITPASQSLATAPTPLSAIYILNRSTNGDADNNDTLSGKIKVSEALNQQSGLLALRNQAFHARFYRGMNTEARLFMQATGCVRSTPVHRLHLPDDIQAMSEGLKQMDLLNPASPSKPEPSEQESFND
ncbi:hypothetical protein MY494_10900 [Synechococcus sp. A10-1-5-1]|uniref:hypothetical protein n=1 Tax=Synechococcus sp. A10-1-5-1 TaxID=2936507 RepID=UPI0020015960|nr:hypothetical protein [Synechococcus sp. A10-1-5-1]UPM49818.1 hypothetical protein MY494_10900 [Synechococcus sp. A10-1-5-1]